MKPTENKIQLCRFLRWKGVHDIRNEEDLKLAFMKNEVPYSCLRTCQAWGPDESIAAPEDCNATRSCFERSTKIFSPE
jgi:hypothetical protein